MPDVLDGLAVLADRPPRPAPPADQIRERAAGRRRRRRLRVGAASLALAAVVVVGAATVLPGDGRPQVATDQGPTTASSVDPADALSRTAAGELVLDRPLGLSITPAADLPESGQVDVQLVADPGGQVFLMQCLAEIVETPPAERADARLSLCGELFGARTPPEPPPPMSKAPMISVVDNDSPATDAPATVGDPADDQLTITVARHLTTGGGVTDCAVAPGRCVVAVRAGGSEDGQDRFAPLAFATAGG